MVLQCVYWDSEVGAHTRGGHGIYLGQAHSEALSYTGLHRGVGA